MSDQENLKPITLSEAIARRLRNTTGEEPDFFIPPIIAQILTDAFWVSILKGEIPGMAKEDPTTGKVEFVRIFPDDVLAKLRAMALGPFSPQGFVEVPEQQLPDAFSIEGSQPVSTEEVAQVGDVAVVKSTFRIGDRNEIIPLKHPKEYTKFE